MLGKASRWQPQYVFWEVELFGVNPIIFGIFMESLGTAGPRYDAVRHRQLTGVAPTTEVPRTAHELSPISQLSIGESPGINKYNNSGAAFIAI